MSYTWFKLHHDLPDDIKMRKFTPQEKWAWVALLCLASKSQNRGVIQADDADIADYCEFNSTQDWLYYRDKLIAKGMLEINTLGKLHILHWEDRQYEKPSDRPEAVRTRVAKHRAKKKEQAVTPCNALHDESNADVTPQIRLDKTRGEEIRSEEIREEKVSISSEDAYISDSGESMRVANFRETLFDLEPDPICPGQQDIARECEVVQGELVTTNEATRQGRSSARGKKTQSKKNSGKPHHSEAYLRVVEIWNEFRPDWFAAVDLRFSNKGRIESVERFVNGFEDCEIAYEVLRDSLFCAGSESFWIGKSLSLENWLTNNKPVRKAEQWRTSGGASGMSEGDIRLLSTYKTLAGYYTQGEDQ